MQNTYKNIILFSLLQPVFIHTNTHASAPAPQPVKQSSTQFVWGTLYTVGRMKYMSQGPNDLSLASRLPNDLILGSRLQNIVDVNQQPITLKSSGVVIGVLAQSEESNNWWSKKHPLLSYCFPRELPISMLEGKKEDEPLQFNLLCPDTKKLFNVILRCKGNDGQELPQVIQSLKKQFADMPNYDPSDRARLLAQQIIVKNPLCAQMQELQNELRNLPSLLWADANETPKICAKTAQLQNAIAQKRAEWTAHHALTDFGTIPEFIHGPNGFQDTSLTSPNDCAGSPTK